jgi:hypothetical protein
MNVSQLVTRRTVTRGSRSGETGTPVPLGGTPNELIQCGRLLDMGGGVYYNTGDGTYQNLTGSIVGTNRHAVQQYTDPAGYLYSGAAYEPSDTYLRETVPNIDQLLAKSEGSPTVILNARWVAGQVHGEVPEGLRGRSSSAAPAGPVALMAYPGVLKAPGRPPLEGAYPSWLTLAAGRVQAAEVSMRALASAVRNPSSAQGHLPPVGVVR